MANLSELIEKALCQEHCCHDSVVGVVRMLEKHYTLKRRPRAESRRRKGATEWERALYYLAARVRSLTITLTERNK